jgi:TusA-related sulfurtransferase
METINVLGKPCPIPVIEAKKALRKAAPGETVRVLVDRREPAESGKNGGGPGLSLGL